MATFMCYITGKLARTIVWILIFILLIIRVTPLVISNLFRVLELIKGRKFMYVFLNSIIISILISSSSFIPYITNIFLKLNENSKLRFTTQKLVTSSSSPDDDDDTWWFFTYMDHELPMIFTSKEDETKVSSSFRVLEEKEERKVEVEDEEEEEEEERDDLDATWKAIMESQGKGSRPQIRKSDTWSCGDGGGKQKEREKEKGGKGRLKKWQSFREMIEGRENVGGDSTGGGGGEKPRRRSMEVALTFHDEFKKRADAFIARFTHDIRLQRLESDQRFLEMINRGL